MKRPGHPWILFVLIATAFVSVDAQAWNWLTLYPLEVEAILRFDGTDRTSDNSEHGTDTEWRAGVSLSLEGYTLDPAIARYLLRLEPTWTTGKIKTNDVTDKRSGNFLNYLIQADILQGTPGPVGFNLALVQTNDLNTGSLGSRYDNEIQDNTAIFNWKNSAFPMRLMYNSRTLKQKFRSSLNSPISERNEKLDTWTIEGSSSKTDLLLEHQSMDDRVPTRNNDYILDRANLNHRLLWGHGSSLRSWWDYWDRTGFNANRRLTISETAHIQHRENVSSRSTYRFYQVTQAFKTTEHSGLFQLEHELYRNLRTEGELGGLTRTSDVVDETQWRAGLRGHYNKSNLLFGGDVSAGLGYAYQLTDRESKLGLIEVVDEAHVVPLAGDVILGGRFILISTIIVTDSAGQLVYNQGLDYEVFTLTEDLTQIQTIPGGRIETGTTILVSYKAQALPTQEFSTTFATVSLGYNLGWMRFWHYDNQSNDNLLSGEGESLLIDRRDTTTSLEFIWQIAEIDTRVMAERRYNLAGEYESTAYTFRQAFGWAASEKAVLSLLLSQQFIESTDRDTNQYYVELSVDWRPLNSLQVRPVVGAWKRHDKWVDEALGERDDTFISAGVRLRWHYRKVIFDMDYYYNQRTINDFQTNEHRLRLNLLRRF